MPHFSHEYFRETVKKNPFCDCVVVSLYKGEWHIIPIAVHRKDGKNEMRFGKNSELFHSDIQGQPEYLTYHLHLT